MRINPYEVNRIYGTQNVKRKIPTTNATKSFSDVLELSSNGRDYQIAKQAIAATSDIREDKVKDIKERMQNGTYNVTAEEFANKILGL